MDCKFPSTQLLKDGENSLKQGILCPQFENRKKSSLTFALGLDEDLNPVCPDLSKLPHLVISGDGGSGKHSLLNCILVSFLYGYTPDELKICIICPDDRTDAFNPYRALPHFSDIIDDKELAAKTLNDAVAEMERRYSLFKAAVDSGVFVSNIGEYNQKFSRNALPRLVYVIDGYSNFDSVARKSFEHSILCLLQKSRACGIHLIILSESSKTAYMSGSIFANIPSRICLKVNSPYDSRRLIYTSDGTKLNAGECYFYNPADIRPHKIQCFNVENDEIEAICKSITD